jgi:predicted RecA/RadA family phage recombinase
VSGAPAASMPGGRWDALVIHPDDDVAVALRDVPSGRTVDVRRAGTLIRAKVTEAIPLGHKFALHALATGAPVRKYGECIGVATSSIAAGSHVHVHNMESRRARKTK